MIYSIKYLKEFEGANWEDLDGGNEDGQLWEVSVGRHDVDYYLVF